MQKWNIATDRAQNANDKNGVISLVIMFTSGVMVIKIPTVAHVLYFVLWQHKISTLWAKYLSASERSYLALLENALLENRLMGSELPLPRCQPLKIQDFGIFLLTQ